MDTHDLQEHHGLPRASTTPPPSPRDSPARSEIYEQRVQAIMGFLSTWGATNTLSNRSNDAATTLDPHGRTRAGDAEQECAQHGAHGLTKGADMQDGKVRMEIRKADVKHLLDSAAENLALERREAYHNGHEVGWHAGRNVGFRLGFACASAFALAGLAIGWWIA